MAANASLDSVKPRFAVDAHLANLFNAESEKLPEERDQQMPQEDAPSSDPVEQEKLPAPSSLPTSLSPEAREALAQHNARRHDWIEQDGSQDRQVSSRWYQRMADLRVSTTDPDATLMLTKNGADMGYHTRLSGRWGQSAYHPDGAGHTDGA